ncbi:MAG: NAD(P)/FAD-dependent oxidoreductase [Parahaliea sp.]
MRADLVIVGAGPAGMAAAQVAAGYGLRVTVIDEQARAGGQLLRQPPATFQVDRWLTHRIYRPQQRLLRACPRLENVQWQHGTTVLGTDIAPDGIRLYLNGPGGVSKLAAKRLLLATGCHDMPVSFPGSTLPGVMATGGIQAFIKSQHIVPGERFVFSGSHPLQLVVADQVLRAGGDVAAVLFSQPRAIFRQLLRQGLTILRHPQKMLYFSHICAHLLRLGVPIHFGQVVSSARGDSCLRQVSISSSEDLRQLDTVACDRLGIGFGFLANSQLASQLGARCQWSDTAGGWLACADSWMRSSIPRVYVAGEITGIGGADVSQREGVLAGLAVAMDADSLAPDLAKRHASRPRRELRALYGFATLLSTLSHPGQPLLSALMTPESILCKCEEVSAGEALAVLKDNPFTADLNALKLQSRCGMGLCQGRYCQYQLRTLLALQRDAVTFAGEGFQSRFPVKPVSIGALAAMPAADDRQCKK